MKKSRFHKVDGKIYFEASIENIVGIGENTGFQHFLFPTTFSKGIFLMFIIRSWDSVNSVTHDMILEWSKLKAFADDKINVSEMLKCVSGRVETTQEREKMLVTSIFSFFHDVFISLFLQGRLKSRLCGKEFRLLKW